MNELLRTRLSSKLPEIPTPKYFSGYRHQIVEFQIHRVKISSSLPTGKFWDRPCCSITWYCVSCPHPLSIENRETKRLRMTKWILTYLLTSLLLILLASPS